MNYIEQIEEIVNSICFLQENITMETRFQEDLCLDSFETINLFSKIENRFNINIDFKNINNIKTVKDVITLIEKCKLECNKHK